MTLFNLQNVLCVSWSVFHFPIWQVTTFQNIEGMLEKVHYVAEGTLIYLRETSEVFIRVRKGWRKLQVLLHYTIIFSNSLPHNGGEGDIFRGRKVWVQRLLFFFNSETPGDMFLFYSPFCFFQLGELIPIPADSLPPPAISSHVSTKHWKTEPRCVIHLAEVACRSLHNLIFHRGLSLQNKHPTTI